MRIGFDVDGPLIDDPTDRFFDFACLEGYGWDYELYALTGCWDLASPGFTHRQRNLLYDRFRGSRFCQPDRPTPGAQQALSLMNGSAGQRHVITTRTEEVRGQTCTFLDKCFPPFSDYWFGVSPKAVVVAELKLDWFIENSLKEANEAAEAGCRGVILFPVRNVRRTEVHPDVIILAAENSCSSGMTDALWEEVCRQAWQEITEIIRRVR